LCYKLENNPIEKNECMDFILRQNSAETIKFIDSLSLRLKDIKK